MLRPRVGPPAIGRQLAPVLRAAARQAGVSPPHQDADGSTPTWQLVGQLLSARAAWDRDRGQPPPEHVDWVACAVLLHSCPSCTPPEPALCVGCGDRLDQVFVDERLDLHPLAPPVGRVQAGHVQGQLLELDQRTA